MEGDDDERLVHRRIRRERGQGERLLAPLEDPLDQSLARTVRVALMQPRPARTRRLGHDHRSDPSDPRQLDRQHRSHRLGRAGVELPEQMYWLRRLSSSFPHDKIERSRHGK